MEPVSAPFSCTLATRDKNGSSTSSGMARFLDEIDIMNVPGRMELRHEQGIHVPELRFDQRPPHLLESHAHELGFDRIEKFAIGMFFPGRNSRRAQTDRVLSKSLLTPTPILQQVGSQLRYFFANPLPQQLRRRTRHRQATT